MNETDFIRQQLAAERAHLREILLAVRREAGVGKVARPISAYIEWAGRRLLDQLGAVTDGATAASDAGDAGAARSFKVRTERLLALLEAWSDSQDGAAGATLPISHWRQAARLSADTILEERQLYAAARAATGLT
ncbi:MAG TPA: hypothetical protein VHW25_04985 [Steroidobacteraceae bacterium]|jgi:hypothetical protein|nr:hypothetical protein [Steroidobacteraceae bacterium]